eukprot:gnl/Dysnectes_brevis/2836_a3462_1141.p1 GENE.gnl/Dysnectes_brevis/2836_a3462_1141~~gnl/Dysnectes_brevis/2836_a3462_1141.p1  ORF type:complete len:248 (-),score=51.27 gnl/Dysnectes_brevis/2836_a3462_1141:413-1156(-)
MFTPTQAEPGRNEWGDHQIEQTPFKLNWKSETVDDLQHHKPLIVGSSHSAVALIDALIRHSKDSSSPSVCIMSTQQHTHLYYLPEIELFLLSSHISLHPSIPTLRGEQQALTREIMLRIQPSSVIVLEEIITSKFISISTPILPAIYSLVPSEHTDTLQLPAGNMLEGLGASFLSEAIKARIDHQALIVVDEGTYEAYGPAMCFVRTAAMSSVLGVVGRGKRRRAFKAVLRSVITERLSSRGPTLYV